MPRAICALGLGHGFKYFAHSAAAPPVPTVDWSVVVHRFVVNGGRAARLCYALLPLGTEDGSPWRRWPRNRLSIMKIEQIAPTTLPRHGVVRQRDCARDRFLVVAFFCLRVGV